MTVLPDVHVRPATSADGPALLDGHRRSLEMHHPWVAPATHPDQMQEWLGRLGAMSFVSLLALDPETNRIAGVFNVSQIFYGGFQSAYLGFYAMEGLAGRGLMTAAMPRVVAYAFDALGLHRLEANVQPGNLRSLALVRRCGFRHEGFSPNYLHIDGAWRDHERFAITTEDVAGQV